MKKSILLFFILLISFVNNAQNLNPNTTASFIYTPKSPLNNKQINVFYHIPNGDITTMPIVFSFHGTNKNADDYRFYCLSMAIQNKFMCFTPEFSKANFPTLNSYNLANIFVVSDIPCSAPLNTKN